MTRTEGELFELPPGARRGGGAKGSGDAAADDAALEARLVPLVRTRTGRTVEFDDARLAASVERARRVAGHDDPALAAEVGDIVSFTLASRTSAVVEGGVVRRPSVEVDEVGWLVERVLVELGHAAVAREYILARDRKARSRVARDGARSPSAGAGVRRLPAVRAAAGTEPFDGRRIAAALVAEAGLEAGEAERVAERVEENLASTSLRAVSTALVRELVSAELLALGLQHALRRHEAVGVPRHDLAREYEAARAPRIDEPPAASAREDRLLHPRFEDLAGDALLARWALEDLVPPNVAERHRAADLHVLGLASLHRPLVRALPVELVAPGAAWGRRSAHGALHRVARLAVDTAHGVVLEDAGDLFASLGAGGSRSAAIDDDAILDYLHALSGVAVGAGRDVGLSRFGRGGAPSLAAVLRASARAVTGGGGLAVRTFATLVEIEASLVAAGSPRADKEETAAAVETLLASGHLVPAWATGSSRWVGPGLLRRRGERGSRALTGAVALNLPRVARRAGPWREDAFLAGLMDLVGVATEALEAVATARSAAGRVQGGVVSDRPSFALVPVGLDEALGILGDGIARVEQGARLLGALHDGATRLGEPRGLEVRVTPFYAAHAARRFARSDAAVGGPEQPRLFADLPVPEDARAPSYSTGAGSLAASDADRAARDDLGAFLATLPSGALLPGADPGGGDPAAVVPDTRGGPGPESGARPWRGTTGRERPGIAAWRRFSGLRATGDPPAPPPDEKSLF